MEDKIDTNKLTINQNLIYGCSLLTYQGVNDKGQILLKDSEGIVWNLNKSLVEKHGKLLVS